MDNRNPRLVLLADGALLHDRNGRLRDLREPGEAGTVDFLKLPSAVAKAAQLPPEAVKKEDSYFFTVGSQKAESFLVQMAQSWTVQTFPLRAFTSACTCGTTTVKFSTVIAWALGRIPAKSDEHLVVCISNDPALVLPVRFSRDQGIDARMAWPDALTEEAKYFAARNEVPVLHLDAAEGPTSSPRHSFGHVFLQDAARSSKPIGPRPRRIDS